MLLKTLPENGETVGDNIFFPFLTSFTPTYTQICHLGPLLPFPKQALVFMCLLNMSFQNTVGKGEIACNKQFLLFPQCFLLVCKTLSFSSNLKWSSANSFSLEVYKIYHLRKT